MIKLFCVVQELPVKKQNKRGYPKRLEVYPETEMVLDRVETTWWRYRFSEECFERPIKKAYKVTVHKSYREGGKVKKIQAVIGTINYYDLAEGCIDPSKIAMGVQKAAKKLNVSAESIAVLFVEKLQPFEEAIQKSFQQTEEYKTHKQYEQIIVEYEKNKKTFYEKFEIKESTDIYAQCYDVFGELKNPKELEHIQSMYEGRKRREQRKLEERNRKKAEREAEKDRNSNHINKNSNYNEPRKTKRGRAKNSGSKIISFADYRK